MRSEMTVRESATDAVPAETPHILTGKIEAARSSAPPRGAAAKRRASRKGPPPGAARYFLVASSGPDRLEFGEEIASEAEALVAAFKKDATFAVVTEWRPRVDNSRSAPVIRKEVAASGKA